MYGIVLHDFMRDILDREFIMVFGKSKKEVSKKAWTVIKKYAGEDIDLFYFENDDFNNVTQSSLSKALIKNYNEDNKDCVLISKTHLFESVRLYIQMFVVEE